MQWYLLDVPSKMAPADLSLAKKSQLVSKSISPLPTGGQTLEMEMPQ